MEKYQKKSVASRDERNDMYDRLDQEIGRDDCCPSALPAMVIAAAAIVVTISLGVMFVWWRL